MIAVALAAFALGVFIGAVGVPLLAYRLIIKRIG